MLGRGRCAQRSGGTDEPPPPNSCRQRSWRCWDPGPQERLQDVHSPVSQLRAWAGWGEIVTQMAKTDAWAAMCGQRPSLGVGTPQRGVGTLSIWSLGSLVGLTLPGFSCCLWNVSLSNLHALSQPGGLVLHAASR